MTHPIHPLLPSHKLQYMWTSRSREREKRTLCIRGVPWVCTGYWKMRLTSPWFTTSRSLFYCRQVEHRPGGALLATQILMKTWRDQICCPKSRSDLGWFIISDPTPNKCSSSPGMRTALPTGSDFHGMLGNQPNQRPNINTSLLKIPYKLRHKPHFLLSFLTSAAYSSPLWRYST